MYAKYSSCGRRYLPGLKGDFDTDDIIPEEVRKPSKKPKVRLQKSKRRLPRSRYLPKRISNDTKATIAEVKASAESDLNDTKATIGEVKTSLTDVKASIETVSLLQKRLRESRQARNSSPCRDTYSKAPKMAVQGDAPDSDVTPSVTR